MAICAISLLVAMALGCARGNAVVDRKAAPRAAVNLFLETPVPRTSQVVVYRSFACTGGFQPIASVPAAELGPLPALVHRDVTLRQGERAFYYLALRTSDQREAKLTAVIEASGLIPALGGDKKQRAKADNPS
jgi:hypothetical protein